MKRVITPCCGRSEEISEEMYKELASEPEVVLKVTESEIHMPCTDCMKKRGVKKGASLPNETKKSQQRRDEKGDIKEYPMIEGAIRHWGIAEGLSHV